MKNFINQVSRLRSQRGAIRFAVACTLLAMLTLVVLGMGYGKFIARAHALPFVNSTLNAPVSACRAIKSKGIVPGAILSGSWTPPVSDYTPKEISSMPDVLLLQAGASLPLSLTQPVNGTWKAEFGVVDASGNYTAPPYTPPTGVDVVTFMGTGEMSYKTFTLRIRILPNPNIPGSSQTPYVVAAPIVSVDKYGEQQRLGGSRAIVFPKSAPLPAAEFLRTVAIVQPGEKPVPPVQVTQVRPAIVSSDKATYILPTVNEVNIVTDAVRVGVQNVGFIPQQAKELPQLAGNSDNNPDPSAGNENDCTGSAPYFTYGAYTETTTPGPIVAAGTLKVDAGMQTAALPLHIDIGDTINVNEIFTNYTRTRQMFEWECVNKKFVHTNTQTCSAVTVGYFIDPQWAAPFVGRKPGHTIEPYPSDVCH